MCKKSINFKVLKLNLIPSVLMSKISNKISHLQEKNLFSDLPGFLEVKKDVQLSFTAPDLSSDGGFLLLSKAERRTGIIESLSKCISDWRNPELIVHSIGDMVSQRVFQIASGYEDADDCDALRHDSLLKMSCGRLPSDDDLCSQPTMSRLENHVDKEELWSMAKVFVNQFIDSYDYIPAKIILDFDDTNANTYGAQQLTLFNEYYGEYCYMPLLVFEGYSGRMVLPILRPGRRVKELDVAGLMIRIIKELRKSWPNTSITVRGDAMFCSHTFFEWADSQRNIHYCIGITGNKVLNNNFAVVNLLAKAENQFRLTGEPQKMYSRFYYKAGSWKEHRWIFVKVEYSRMGQNIRFIVVDRGKLDPKETYEKVYCKRGDCELYIKELKNDLVCDRMSCGSFRANQFRLFLHAAAYVLMWHIRHVMLKGTDAEDWTVSTFRLRIMKSAVRITEMKTRIKLEFTRDHPHRRLLEKAFRQSA